MLARMWRHWNPCILLVGKMEQLLRKTIFWFLKKLNMGLPYDSAIPLLGICPKYLKTGIQESTSTCSQQHYSQ